MRPSASKVLDFLSKPVVLGCLIFLISSFIRWISLAQTEFGNGWDSYFYLVQLKSILTEGKMHSPEWTLFYPLLLLVNLFSPDPITSVKVLSSLLAGAFSALIYLYALKFCLKKEVALLVAAITFFSPELTYFTAQWPKNLLGIDLLLALLLAIAHNKRSLVIIFLVLGLFGHRMTALLGIGCVFYWLINKYLPLKFWIVAGIGLISLIMVTLIFPGIINLKDYQRVQNLISVTPQFSVSSFISTFGWEKISVFWLCELIAASILTLVLLVRESGLLIKKNRSDGLVIVLLMITLWFPFYYWEISGAAYRFFHVGVSILPLILMFTINSLQYKKPLAVIAITILCGLSLVSWKSYNPRLHDPPYTLYDKVTVKVSIVIKHEKPELIIAHKSLAEFFTYSTGIDAMPWIPDYIIDDAKLWRIAVLPYPQLFTYYIKSVPTHLISNYYYISESQWQLFIKQLKQNENADLVKAHLTWHNPNEVRPDFLKKKK